MSATQSPQERPDIHQDPPVLHHDGHDEDACARAIAQVHAFLTNQLPASQADLIRAHLDACEKCLDDFDIEATISKLLKKSCGSPGAPDSLRLRVMTLRVDAVDPER